MTSDEELLVHLASIEQMLAELEESRAHSDVKPELLRRFDEAERTFPAGYVVVLAAADCARAGSKYPLPGADLIGLAHDYAARLWPGESIGDDELRAGIEWAASCEEGQLPLLISAGEDAYRASPAIAGGAGVAHAAGPAIDLGLAIGAPAARPPARGRRCSPVARQRADGRAGLDTGV
jgi:hypothetical protein